MCLFFINIGARPVYLWSVLAANLLNTVVYKVRPQWIMVEQPIEAPSDLGWGNFDAT